MENLTIAVATQAMHRITQSTVDCVVVNNMDCVVITNIANRFASKAQQFNRTVSPADAIAGAADFLASIAPTFQVVAQLGKTVPELEKFVHTLEHCNNLNNILNGRAEISSVPEETTREFLNILLLDLYNFFRSGCPGYNSDVRNFDALKYFVAMNEHVSSIAENFHSYYGLFDYLDSAISNIAGKDSQDFSWYPDLMKNLAALKGACKNC